MGGTVHPVTPEALERGDHIWKARMPVLGAFDFNEYFETAQSTLLAQVQEKADFSTFDFLATTAGYNIKSTVESLERLKIPPSKYVLTTETLGHMGTAATLVSLNLGLQQGRNVGPRLLTSARTYAYSNALAIRGSTPDLGIRVLKELN